MHEFSLAEDGPALALSDSPMKRASVIPLSIRSIALATLVFLPLAANAAAILQPLSASTNMGEFFLGNRAINKSGLSRTYTSLVTDFDAFIATNPTAAHGNGANIWGSTLGVRAGNFDLNLGGTFLVSGMAFWNLVGDVSSVRQFNLLADSDASFGNPVNLGLFTASNVLGIGASTSAQVFTFPQTTAAFIRIQILNTWSPTSDHAAFNEVAFKATSVPAPEPTATCLLGLGALGLASRRRRQREFF